MDGETLMVGSAGGGQTARVPGVELVVAPEAEVRPGRRRRFSAAYKRRILAEAAACEHGGVGALLRREGLFSSHLTKWRREFAGTQGAGADKRPAVAGDLRSARQRLAKAEGENQRLRLRLAQAEAIMAVQKKLWSLLQIGLQGGEN